MCEIHQLYPKPGLGYPSSMVARISLAIASCNATPDRREIIPTSRARRMSIVSCNATPRRTAASLRVSRNRPDRVPFFRPHFFQYCGCRLRHSRTRATFSQPQKWPFPAVCLSHFCWETRRLAWAHAGREQKRCRFPSRGLTPNWRPQWAHQRSGLERCPLFM